MAKNNLGFTMVELLAAVVVLGISMMVAIPSVIDLLNDQRSDTYIKDALRLASNMDNKLRSDNKITVPRRGGCVAINLTYMDNNTFEEGPYGGEYDRWASFVVAKRNSAAADEEYTYYVRLIEKTPAGAFRGVDLKDSNRLYEIHANRKYVSNLGVSDAYSLTDYEGSEASFITHLAGKGISCSTMEIYAPEDYE